MLLVNFRFFSKFWFVHFFQNFLIFFFCAILFNWLKSWWNLHCWTILHLIWFHLTQPQSETNWMSFQVVCKMIYFDLVWRTQLTSFNISKALLQQQNTKLKQNIELKSKDFKFFDCCRLQLTRDCSIKSFQRRWECQPLFSLLDMRVENIPLEEKVQKSHVYQLFLPFRQQNWENSEMNER